MAEVPVIDEHALVSVKDMPSSFYKICIEAPNNIVNRWIIIPAEKGRDK